MSIKKTALELIEDIKNALKFEDTPTPADPATPPVEAPAALTAYKLADGSEIMISALEVGGDVKIGEEPAPAATYALEDGSSIVVGEDGKIAEIIAKAEEVAPLPEDMNAKFEARVLALETQHSEFKAAYDTAIEGYNASFEAFNQKIEAQNGIITKLLELAESLAETPSQEVPAPKKSFSFSTVETGKDKLDKYAKAARTLAENNKK